MDKINIEDINRETLAYFSGDELARDAWVEKYCLKDSEDNYYELTPDDMHMRMSKEFARIENQYPNPIDEETIYNLFKDFKYLIPQGSPMAGIGNPFKYSTLSSCYVIADPYDSYAGILKAEQEQIFLMKTRGGVGFSLHSLRPQNMPTSSVSNKSSGLVLFGERYSNGTREVAQDGRRGALMLSTRITHPDIEQFIDAKLDLKKITGANISIMITDDFMESLSNGQMYETYFEGDTGKVSIEKNSKHVWGKIVHNAWKSAEPGILFWDNILNESIPSLYGDDWKETSTNPCQPFWSKILTLSGVKLMGDITVGDYIWSESGWTKVVNKVSRGNKDVYRYSTTFGSIYCTKDHRIVQAGVKVKAQDAVSIDLLRGDYKKRVNCHIPQHVMDGLVLGDGAIHKASNNLIHLFIGDNDQDYFSSQIKELIIKHRPGLSPKAYEISTNLFPDEVCRTWDRQIPKRYMFGDSLKIKSLLRGLYSANGSVVDRRVTLKATSKKIIDQVQLLLNSIGISSYFTTNKSSKIKHKNGIYKSKQSYDLNISRDRDLFYSEIGFIQHYKTQKLLDVINDVKSSTKEKISRPIINFEIVSNEEVFDITVDNNNHTYWSGGFNISNCSELPLCPYDSCRLLAINLFSYVKDPFTKKAYFDFNLFGGHVMMAQKFLDDMIDLEIERIDRIIDKIKADNQPEDLKYVELNLWEKIRKKALDGRRTGLGITAVGDMLAALNLRYGTVKASDFEVKVTKALAIKSYLMSVLLAKDRGSFPIWDYEKEKDSVFINRLIKETFDDMSHWGTFEHEYRKYGRRNIANLTIAPTGTTSLMAQTTSGIEPLFLPKYKRRKKVNKETENIFVDEVGDIWEEYDVIHSKFQMWFDINWRSLFPGWLTSTDEEKPILKDLNEDIFQMVFEQSPYYKATSNDVDWLEKVRMQGRVQKFIDHSISCTVNVPKEATEELISQIYQTAWESKCKGLTVYRDGSRTGILVNNDSEVNLKYNDATKRGEVLPIDIYHKTALKKNWLVIVGLKKDKPYEIFAIHDIENHIFPTAITNGTLTKVKSGVYKLVGEYSGKEYIVENIIDKMSNEVGTNTRKYSMMLRHGIHPKYIVSEIDEYSLITSFDKVVGRVLKKYFDQETKGKCPECGGELVFREGCISCISCSYSLCT